MVKRPMLILGSTFIALGAVDVVVVAVIDAGASTGAIAGYISAIAAVIVGGALIVRALSR